MLTREQIAMRAAQELRDGYYVNLGIGGATFAGRTTSRPGSRSSCSRKTACSAWALPLPGRGS